MLQKFSVCSVKCRVMSDEYHNYIREKLLTYRDFPSEKAII